MTHADHISALLAGNNYPPAVEIVELPSSGSNRHYFRVSLRDQESLLAAFNRDVSENIAWYSFSQHFHQLGLRVPRIFCRDETYTYFLLQDLGNTDLLSMATASPPALVEETYRMVLKDLLRFQVEGIRGLDLDVAYPAGRLDRNSIMWDLNYFKYYFVKPHELPFDEGKLELDFQAFAAKLLEAGGGYFMYRDFQARNILLHEGEPWYIDFQGGREGPLMYDVASLLYQARANLGKDLRSHLLRFYLEELDNIAPGQSGHFQLYYHYFACFRLMQVLGAYGFRGMIQRKGHFLKSIPFALDNLAELKGLLDLQPDYPELHRVFTQLLSLTQYRVNTAPGDLLNVQVNSFSYKKKGYPLDFTDHGGGFVFDCRGLPNPGRLPELRDYTGLQKPVIEFLQAQPGVQTFADHAYALVSQHIEEFLNRGFNHLQVNFGCTGGKHRSVYMAELLSTRLRSLSDRLNVKVNHTQLDD